MKKIYEKPELRAIEIQTEQFIATSTLGEGVSNETAEGDGW